MLVLLGFGRPLTIKCILVNNQPYMVRPTLIDLNPDELRNYPFISLDKCGRSCNTVEDPFGRICMTIK